MLLELLPFECNRLSSLPVLGPILDGYGTWLLQRGHPVKTIREYLRPAGRLEERITSLGVASSEELTRDVLQACRQPMKPKDFLPTLVNSLDRYLLTEGRFHCPEPNARESVVTSFGEYLRKVLGFASFTIQQYATISGWLLRHVRVEGNLGCLRDIDASVIESFIKSRGQKVGRVTLQKTVSATRSFLRFLAMSGLIDPGFDGQIIPPRVYCGERLPRALPWDTVRAFLGAIDRTTPIGKRDYAMFLLMATYGLRRAEVGSLKLENIEWRHRRICLGQSKTDSGLALPLTDEVGASLVDYLQHGRPKWPFREVFLRTRAPARPLGAPAITAAFHFWARRSALPIPFFGPHCLRHSLAVHLLRQGSSLKEIGDILGHHGAGSTCIYIRLAVEDLREVALPLPSGRRS